MESVLGRYRNLIILVGVLFLQVLGLAVQVKRSARRGKYAPDPHLGGGRDHSLRTRPGLGCRTAPAISGTTIFTCAACAPRTANSKIRSSR